MGDSQTQVALALAGGGARGAYQAGVLSFIGEQCPEFFFPIVTGVSAGAINALHVASHPGDFTENVYKLESDWRQLTTDRIYNTQPQQLGRTAIRWARTLGGGGTLGRGVQSLVDTSPLREYLEQTTKLQGLGQNIKDGRLRALGITATSYETGQTITFVEGQQDLPLWRRPHRQAIRDSIGIKHIMASSALPLVFPAIEVNGHYYGDGGIRQTAPLSPAIHLGADKILSISPRYHPAMDETDIPESTDYPTPSQIMGLLFNNIFQDALSADATQVERINRILRRCEADSEIDDLQHIDIMVIEPSEDIGQLAKNYEDQLPRAVRFLTRGLGVGKEQKSSDFVSYLLFEQNYISRLIELGRDDAAEQWDKLATFLEVDK